MIGGTAKGMKIGTRLRWPDPAMALLMASLLALAPWGVAAADGALHVRPVPTTAIAPQPAADWPHEIQHAAEVTYRAAPALALGLGVVALVPLLAMGGVIVRYLRRTRMTPPAAKAASSEDIANMIAPWPAVAWMESTADPGPQTDGQQTRVHCWPLSTPITRIGRDDDNEIRLAELTVHRYHAAIQRDCDGTHFVRDLSSQGGNGVRVNGQPVGWAPLNPGDQVHLGLAVLTYRAEPAGATMLSAIKARQADPIES